jgi:hypothetical protein
LIDAVTGAHLWADRFDGSLEDVFDLQDDVAISGVGVIEPTLQTAEIRRATDRPTNDPTGYGLPPPRSPPAAFDLLLQTQFAICRCRNATKGRSWQPTARKRGNVG